MEFNHIPEYPEVIASKVGRDEGGQLTLFIATKVKGDPFRMSFNFTTMDQLVERVNYFHKYAQDGQ